MAQLLEVKVPDIGGFNDVPVIEVAVKPGDAVKAEDAADAGIRQGDDGRAGAGQRHSEGSAGQGRRQGFRRDAGGGDGECGVESREWRVESAISRLFG